MSENDRFEGRRVMDGPHRKGMRHVASIEVGEFHRLRKVYGENWMQDKGAIRHAAERHASVAQSKRQLEYAADAARANSRGGL